MTDIDTLSRDLFAQLDAAQDEAAVEVVRVNALGKKGSVSELLKGMGGMSPEERQSFGPLVNGLKQSLSDAIAVKKEALAQAALDARLLAERIDVTLPVRPERRGKIHPIMQVFEEVQTIFADMGFAIAEGPDVEDDFHNFTALNFPPKHPARDMHDTFFFEEKEDGSRMLLRTHTSPVQVRTMLNQKPPIRIVAPGRTYRCDSDQTHTPMFHQIEGLVIEDGVHMGHLKGVLMDFMRAFFEIDDVDVRFRPHHFPFTEPSAEMDVRCDRSGGALKIGTGTDWLEILGCGMVHPNVLRACGIDPDQYQGFAFGMGIDRLAMLKYGIPDLRDMFAADVRWLKHYGFEPTVQPNLATGLS
ncbi:phenylalanine--tRNA ligase subunit alpha [Aquidulcibacter sp.]|jgi:phenylalanyl-tRNA synthetase alpha chain|uniref:phenylalanine--tRNA ligase subunit alpha n=1 Tax=Aquidulcibacter sp. TaxID=2052990 RepID=UPI00078EC230|nr:phenylalanine--tRNA ligase subunit alpha [Aquidulcibacter sp.]AMS30269.1 phenylalanyl-tRNA synthetase subunit alpha [Hyphomonadaceae bacterium UKL13-1]MCA3698052.1 phenylalanine--tRNA ligase subunit alpha [Aquidulcibacter sp.]OYU50773.1 MAG: phenylalanine--tRNA ligase subunit alpha [Alphaproteobacteria bacterium PA1]HCP62975.1 phenylalanine--tRNA ligase subunit alpha [Hyphomonadaceae bacterium]